MYLDETGTLKTPVVIAQNINLSSLLKLDNGKAWIGFTGATGTAVCQQEILEFNYSPCNLNNISNISSINYDDDAIVVTPNPSNGYAVIHINIKQPTFNKVDIIDINGKVINQIWNGFQDSGTYSYPNSLNQLPSGHYFIRLIVGKELLIKEIQIIR